MAPPSKTSIMLVSGEYFDPFAPDPRVITLDVLAAGMRCPRFKGQTRGWIDIGEHSMRVQRIARSLAPGGNVELCAVVHDTHEPLSPWVDMPSPWKDDRIRELERRLDECIAEALGLPEFSAGERDIVRTADAIALYFEALVWQPGASDWAPLVWPPRHKITGGGERPRPSRGALIERFMPLIAPRPGECWRTEVEALLVPRVSR